jgi:hypothetical protein
LDLPHRDPGRPPEKVRTRRPGAAILILVGYAVFALPVLRVLIDSAVSSPVSVSGVIASVLVLIGLPLGALGLHALAAGTGWAPGLPPSHVWLRPPLAYLPVALVLFVAAGLAAS